MNAVPVVVANNVVGPVARSVIGAGIGACVSLLLGAFVGVTSFASSPWFSIWRHSQPIYS